MENLKKELQFNKEGKLYEDGYRIVYFYDDETYKIGEYCKTIEGFMIGFVDCDPIYDENDIPEFTTIDDLLNRYLDDVYDAVAVALYKTDGTCIQKNNRTTKKTGLFI